MVTGVHMQVFPLLMVANYNHGGYKMDDNEISVILMLLATIQIPFLVSVEEWTSGRGREGRWRGGGEMDRRERRGGGEDEGRRESIYVMIKNVLVSCLGPNLSQDY